MGCNNQNNQMRGKPDNVERLRKILEEKENNINQIGRASCRERV